jgi:mono/diheme cytochrome c family protein
MRYAIGAAMLAAAMLGGAEFGRAADKQDDAKKPAAKPEAKAKLADAKPQAGSKPVAATKPVSFKADVAPILVQHCLACHGPSDPKGEYQLQTFERLTKAGASGLDPVVAGKPDDGELLRLLTSDDKDERMPKDGDPLKKEQIDVIRRWIVEGAKFDAPNKAAELVSLVPRKAHPNPPETYRTAMPVTALAFSPSGSELAVGGYHEIMIWDAKEPKLLRRIKDVEQRVFGLVYSADGKQLAVAGGTPGVSGEAALYDPASGKLIRRLGTMSDVALGLAYSPDGKQLAVCAADRSIRVYDPTSGKETLLIEDHADWVMCIAWSADGKRLVSGSRDKTAKVFDAATGDSQTTYPGHGETVLGVAFAPDGKTVYSSGADKKIHLWNPEDAKQTATIVGFAGEVYRVQIVDGDLFSCSADKTAKRHQLSDRKATGDYKGHADYVFSLAVHPGTKRLATGGFDGEVKLWNLDDAKEVASFRAAPGLTVASAEKK